MGRKVKTKKNHQRDKYTISKRKELKDFLIIFEGFTKALTHDEINEITEFTRSYAKILKTIENKYNSKIFVANYVISDETCKDFKECPGEITSEIYQILVRFRKRMSESDPCLDLKDRFYTSFMMHLSFLSAEAIKREFTSILTFVHFIKLTLRQEEGVYGGFFDVSDVEKLYIRRCFLMKQNFMMKWGICIDMESPKVQPMTQANVPAAGRLNPYNRKARLEGDTVASLHFPVLETDEIPSAFKFTLHYFLCLRREVVAEKKLVFMTDMPESQWSFCKNQLNLFLNKMLTMIESWFNEELEGILTEKDNVIAAYEEIVKFKGELEGLLSYVTEKQATEQSRWEINRPNQQDRMTTIRNCPHWPHVTPN